MNMFTRILRRAALLLVLTTLCATVALAAENGFAERLAQEIAQAPSATASNYWKYCIRSQWASLWLFRSALY